ncbi:MULTISPECIES: MFS transporter [unclassified Mesorhizobium]|uniref:MFS transporter n=1 Tax=unclassified Mesorhizobium TaxID=325217 RepID=UPI00096184C2|nr:MULTISPECIES: MFS transporter [unclassified Mesorhizobium]MBN9258452.1 MFS transporter [Mesorhizobium sp.]MBN9270492.1 MFS transporter [Mesorhizobium sp.]OJX77262.1 MAG: MFS transporter [Mesorhizobium sp. 65-26]
MDKRLFWLALGSFTISTEGFVISSLLPDIAADAGISIPLAGSLITAFALAYAVGTPVLATLTGEWDRRRVILWTLAFFVLGNLVAAFSSSFEVLLIARIVMALSSGLFAATAQGTAVALVDDHHRARAIAVVVGGTTVAVAVGAPLGALVAAFAGWRGTFFAIAGLGALAGSILWWRLPRGLVGTRLPLGARLAAALRPGVMPILATTLLALTGAFTVFAYVAPLAIQGAGLVEIALPGMLLAFGVGAVIGNIAGGQAADRFGATRTVCWSLGLSAAMLVLLSVIPAFLPRHFAGPALMAMMVPWGIVGWAFPPAQASRIIKLAPDAAPIVLSLNASALYLGVAAGAVVGGEVLRFGAPADLGLIAAAFPIVGLGVVLAGRMFARPVAMPAE